MPIRRGAKAVLALVAIALIVLAVDWPALVGSLIFTPVSEGTRLDVQRARTIVAEQPALLAEIQTLGQQPEGDAKRRRGEALAAQIGALWISTVADEAAHEGGRTVEVCFGYYGGAGETYFEGIQWLPPEKAQRVRSGGMRLGEDWGELSGGWFWAIW